MANYTVGGYSQNSFGVTPEGKLILDPNFDASEDALRYEIEEADGGVLFNGDDAADEQGDGDQIAEKYDAQGNLIAQGNVYLEESWTLTDDDGNTITLYKVESNGVHSGWVADGEIIPGKAYSYSGPNDVTAGNAPRYDSLNTPSYEQDAANDYDGSSHGDYAYTGAGDDTVHTGDGNDQVSGGAGNDSLSGEAGNDTLSGGDGNDQISGGSGDDLIYAGSGNDTVDGGAGNDTIYGDGGNDLLRGGSGNDTIYGGSGDDTIDGGVGNDVLHGDDGNDRIDGGSGNDTLTGGAGDDTFVQSQNGGTTITDFDIGDADGDGVYNDQLDVSELRTPEGRAINVHDVVVSDDGNGNAVLTFPEGETIILQGVSPAQISSTQQLNAAGIPCFTAGTRIATARGPIPVEAVRVGDRVQTRDNGLRRVRWIGQRSVDRHDLAANPMLRPVHIAPGTFGNTRALRLSPQHALALQTDRGVTQLVRAGHLARMQGGAVRVARGVQAVTYYHLLLDSHDLILAEGVACESFYPGPWGLASVGPNAALDLMRMMPDLRNRPVAHSYGPTAHPIARFGRLPPDLRALSVAS